MMGMREYENLKDLVIPEEREKIMDIFCAAWDECRDREHCEDCPERQMLKENFALLECFSLKYSRMLVEAGYAPVVHGKWEWHAEQHGNPVDGMDEDFGYRCSRCKVWADEYGVDGDVHEEPPTNILHYCPNCGAKMDEGE